MELTIPWTPVKALLNLAGKADIRKWVNGVWIDQQGPHMLVWATNGTSLGVLRTEEPSTDTGDVFLPRHILEVCKSFTVQATVKKHDDGRRSISCMGTTHYWQDEGFTPIEWRRVIPVGHLDGQQRQVNVDLLPPFSKVREVLRGRKNGDGPDGILVELDDVPTFVGVVMPLRPDVLPVANMRRSAPDWVRERGRVQAEETDLA